MKILIVGELAVGELGRSYMDAFVACGADVVGVDYMQEYNRSPFAENRVASRVFRTVYANAMSRRIVEAARAARPKLVLVVKGHWLSPDAIVELQSLGALVFNYYPDSPFEKSRSNTSPWLLKAIPRYDVFFTFADHLIPSFKQAGCKRAIYLPFASDLFLHFPVEDGEDLEAYRCDVSFVGNIDEERAQWLPILAGYGLKLWGVSYPRSILDNPCLSQKVQGRPLYGVEFGKALKASKICLNLMRSQNLASHNMRTYEAAACRGFVLSQRTPEVTRLFLEDKEAVYFSTPEELRTKLDYYLAHPEERERIAEAGLRRAQQETYTHRARRIIQEYERFEANR